ncbi:MAG: VOC family protein [Runella sp.]
MKNKIIFLTFWLFSHLSVQAQVPILFDDIHYYFTDRQAANDFFIKNFAARPMAEQPMNPLTFIDFLDIKNGQLTINISGKGPFEGVRIGDPNRWTRGLVVPQPDRYVYGQHWLAIATPNLNEALRKLKKNSVMLADVPSKMPFDPKAKTAAVYATDYNLVLVVEREMKEKYAIDHVQMLCEDVEANVKFYSDVLGATLLERKGKSAKMKVAQHILVLSEPEDLGLTRAQVQKKDRTKFFPGPDLFGFLYDEEGLQKAYHNAVAKGYKFLMPPTRLNFFDKPSPYVFCILFSPDNFQIELQTEDGRTGPRTTYK